MGEFVVKNCTRPTDPQKIDFLKIYISRFSVTLIWGVSVMGGKCFFFILSRWCTAGLARSLDKPNPAERHTDVAADARSAAKSQRRS